ncbi:MAG TPA: gamma-glutamyltransferase [Bryobacteraceae bacterium]|nr:gamma-glutamyltransferase [Bryobacteraceae bacterium]
MAFPASSSLAQSRSQARSMVISTRGIVATEQTLASQAGAQILARGGSAVDAAIAANAALSVVEPMMCGPGGDLFALVRDSKTGQVAGINASGWSPQALSLDYVDQHGFNTIRGIHAVTVPGCVDGWHKLHQRFGHIAWRDLFQPAIYYASHGFPVTELIQWEWQNSSLMLQDEARSIYLPQGRAPNVGEIFRNPELAHAFYLIAELGPDAFYRGQIAEAILKTSRRYGGTLAAADLSEYESEWVQPISTTYRGWEVYELPPNGQGIGTLEMLNILENFQIGDYSQDGADALHLKIEAQKLAIQDLRRYLGDPRHAPVPVQGLLSKSYARERAALIDPLKANCSPVPGRPDLGHTTYLGAVDTDGNVVSWIQSIANFFGSGIVVDGMGILLHDRGASFVTEPGHPNALAPRKRPFHTIIPGFMQKDTRHVGFGIMRGMNQAQAQMQLVTNIVDHGMNIQHALEAPRFTKQSLGGCDVQIESRVREEARQELIRRGHRLSVVGDYSEYMGGGQVVMHDSAAMVNYGASSPRKDGAAVPEPDPYFKS